jgi:hypothetical protein
VVEVFAATPGGREDSFGSGYLMSDGLVLTARHVVEGASGRCEVRPLGAAEWTRAEVVWQGEECDAALLGAPEQKVDEPVRLGRVGTAARVACRSLGFPLAQARGDVRDTEEIVGEIVPLAARKSGLLTVHIEGSVPDADASGHSPWEGYSGAALFCGSLLVGVLAVDPAHFGSDRLEAAPVAAMAREPGFCAALGVASPGLLAAVEDEPLWSLLKPPYMPLPAGASPDFFCRSPVHLCLPQYGIVPFHGRDGELAQLTSWLEGEGFTLALLLGGGGTGKTRLAAELSQRTLAEGWLAGFLDKEADAAALVSAVSPLFVVVDEAQTRLDELASLISCFAANGLTRPTRLLLLSREAGEWWQTTLPGRVAGGLEAELALDGTRVVDLGPLEERPDARTEAFQEAAHAFAERTGLSMENLADPDLSDELFERVLFIHLAALTALEGGPVPHGPLVRAELLDARLLQEARYWETTAGQADLETLDALTLQRAVALATLASPVASEGEAALLLASVPDLADEREGVLRRTARWLGSLYPGEGYLRPLEPDILGEQLVSSVLADVPELAKNLLARCTPDEARRPLTVLTHAARASESAESALRGILREQLASVWEPAIDVATETGDPIGALLAEALKETPHPELAEEMVTRLPWETVALRELAVVATQQALQQTGAQTAGPERDKSTADLLNALSHRLSNLGRREEALDAIEKAIEIRRRLADAQPEVFLPGLARALDSRSNHLANLGHREEALAAIDEALPIFRQMAEAHPDTLLPDLAWVLDTRSNRLADLGRYEEALDASEEAVAILEGLEEARPGAWVHNLAALLGNLSNHRASLGRPEEALAACDEAIRIYRLLAEAQPDADLPNLAANLLNYAATLSDLGRHEEALATDVEAVGIYRRLAEARPQAFLPELARALTNQAAGCANLGRPEEALAAGEEAVGIYRRLAEALPDAFVSNLADALNNLAVYRGNVGRHEEALAAGEEAVGIYRRLAEALPDAFLFDLAMGLATLATTLDELARRKEALEAGEEAAGMYRRLAEAYPDAFLPTLADALNNLAIYRGNVGRHEEALDPGEEAVGMYRRLAKAHPDAYLPRLADALYNLGANCAGAGRGEEALPAMEDALNSVLPLLDAALPASREAIQRMLQSYLDLASQTGSEPDAKLAKRATEALGDE